MACALLPAGVAAALPSPRRSAAAPKGQPNQVACTNQLHCKLPLSEPHRSWSLVGCCTCSGSSTGAAMSRRSADAVSFHTDVSLRNSVDAVLGAQIVISGYWIGPDVEDGSGHVQAILQRIH
ncbi:uncharacterized protein LOC125535743 isoform X1 [Triticum urartu]|uniref:Uncharacterized protein n=1 Tax=Triticum urartu TaxID=4572 RepID=A0A8R7TDL1_TRIUA|nr:uncharacterized protein LOC119353369 isoform X1 [Triticum dicoccoides]XP_037475873.1 uncharacterized protein LOC119353369 isoform X1 [Triticum dicoccoides]XP_037475874.1 uncharacterized protein LOC119353369 isoform X1 [Triticum dicoccoides]XP_048554769.1 uncharacterized protein LOC125535743 isoform X1 [Triticum urartu]XP_048554770.1 uncharacterized protein LOC125535743 isoform X1 [Triticum urartu]